ncbi:hypothetical protein KJ865_14710, partial [Myxococcota bacterium]|nr:hypothetical protein [Myxococcota bacterium]
ILQESELDQRFNLLATFIDSLLLKEVTREEILRFFGSQKLSVGDWQKFVEHMSKGNKQFVIVPTDDPDDEIHYVLETKKGYRGKAAARKSPSLPSPLKELPEPVKKPATTSAPSRKKEAKPEPVPQSSDTTFKIPAGDKPVSITIRIEIG